MSATIFETWHQVRLGLPRQQCLLGYTQALHTVCFRPVDRIQLSFLLSSAHSIYAQGGKKSPLGSLSCCASKRTFQTSSALFARQHPRFQRSNSANDSQFSLPSRNIARIFGEAMTREDGNHLLASLEKHRRGETLDEEIPYSKRLIAAGLKYLRARHPMNEEAAILARIDKELASQFRLPQTNTEHSPYGTSKLAKIRRENQERFEREEALREAREERAQKNLNALGTTDMVAKPRTMQNLVRGKERTHEEPEWRKRYREKATETTIPNISTLARLLPSGIFTFIVVALSLSFAQNYVPPSQQARLFPDTPPAATTVMAILGVNFTMYCLWKVPQMWSLMNKYFIVLVLRPRAASMFLTPFSHQEFGHMAPNMIMMWFLGVRCEISELLLTIVRHY